MPLPAKQGEQLETTATVDGERPGARPGEPPAEEPRILEDICVEELAIDGICGVY